jgi:hypothetical protein
MTRGGCGGLKEGWWLKKNIMTPEGMGWLDGRFGG